jgi:anti-sigma factor RsiW
LPACGRKWGLESMKPCHEHKPRLALYIDGELSGRELAEFESHLTQCAGCGEALMREQQFLEDLRCARPLYSAEGLEDIAEYRAPPRLRVRVLKILEHAAPSTPKGWRPYLQSIFFLLLVSGMGAM